MSSNVLPLFTLELREFYRYILALRLQPVQRACPVPDCSFHHCCKDRNKINQFTRYIFSIKTNSNTHHQDQFGTKQKTMTTFIGKFLVSTLWTLKNFPYTCCIRVATESGTFLKLKLCQNEKGQTFVGMLVFCMSFCAAGS